VVCVCVRPHIIEVKRVYDMCQHIFSSEESMCWSFIIYSLSSLFARCYGERDEVDQSGGDEGEMSVQSVRG